MAKKQVRNKVVQPLKNRVTNGQNLGFAVLIIIILTLIVINFGNITGKATVETKSNLKISIEPEIVRSRGTIWITIIPVDNVRRGYFADDIDIVDENDRVVGHANIAGCGVNCRKEMTGSYLLPELESKKEYFVRVLDWDSKGYVKAPFVVIRPYN